MWKPQNDTLCSDAELIKTKLRSPVNVLRCWHLNTCSWNDVDCNQRRRGWIVSMPLLVLLTPRAEPVPWEGPHWWETQRSCNRATLSHTKLLSAVPELTGCMLWTRCPDTKRANDLEQFQCNGIEIWKFAAPIVHTVCEICCNLKSRRMPILCYLLILTIDRSIFQLVSVLYCMRFTLYSTVKSACLLPVSNFGEFYEITTIRMHIKIKRPCLRQLSFWFHAFCRDFVDGPNNLRACIQH